MNTKKQHTNITGVSKSLLPSAFGSSGSSPSSVAQPRTIRSPALLRAAANQRPPVCEQSYIWFILCSKVFQRAFFFCKVKFHRKITKLTLIQASHLSCKNLTPYCLETHPILSPSAISHSQGSVVFCGSPKLDRSVAWTLQCHGNDKFFVKSVLGRLNGIKQLQPTHCFESCRS